MREHFTKAKFFALAGGLLLAGFVWTGMSGSRLLGDDLESVDKLENYKKGSGGRSYGRHNRFYHK
ncbi:hypothetical protein ACO2Q8_02040 [Larkinella sp. VNQ87]|uniref:hypothetical protein n=1 Tax=Larkinella sp. VNQ87 TaxID=3400921 RepID=UPI003C0B728E